MQLVIGHEAPGCEDYDPSDPPEAVLDYIIDDLSIEVYRNGVMQSCDSEFDPDLSLDGRSIDVREYWSESGGDDCTSCFSPRILIKDPAPGVYDIEWYLEDALVPFDNVQVEVD